MKPRHQREKRKSSNFRWGYFGLVSQKIASQKRSCTSKITTTGYNIRIFQIWLQSGCFIRQENKGSCPVHIWHVLITLNLLLKELEPESQQAYWYKKRDTMNTVLIQKETHVKLLTRTVHRRFASADRDKGNKTLTSVSHDTTEGWK